MTLAEYLQVLPIWILNFGAMAVLVQITLRRQESWARWISIGAVSLALGAAFWLSAGNSGVPPTRSLFLTDPLGLFALGLVLVGALAVLIFCEGYFRGRQGQSDEFYLLLLLAAAGAGVMVLSGHFLSFYLGLEILSVSLYGLVGYERQNLRGTEAAVKYLLLAAITAAFFLFGTALVYAETGNLGLFALVDALKPGSPNLVLLAGLALMLVGVSFKLSLFPFHTWSPDVYEGAPLPVAAFLATVSKVAMVAFLLRLVQLEEGRVVSVVAGLLALLAILSMLGGNLLALRQGHVKRVLAYSSTAHMGYVLVPLTIGGSQAMLPVLAYLAAYVFTSLAAFGALILLVIRHPEREKEDALDLRGVRETHPFLALVLVVAFLSLAGIPLTAGFMGKFLLVNVGALGGAYGLLMVLVAGSVLGAYYYLRVVMQIFAPLPDELKTAGEAETTNIPALRLGHILVGLLVLALFGWGLLPDPWLQALQGFLVS